MKESKFIELLNLYIDQQISPADAGLLEDDIQHNARHRRIYQQYCRMHRACTMVLENLGNRAESDDAAAEAPAGRVVALAPHARRWRWGYAAAALAAAACVAIVAVQRLQRPPGGAGAAPIAAHPAPVPAPMTSALAVANGPVRLDAPAFQDRGLPTEAFVSRRLTLGSSNELAAVSLVIAPADPGVAPAARGPLVSRSGSSERPTIEQFVFQTSPTPADNPQIYRGRRATDGDAERTAYEFKR